MWSVSQSPRIGKTLIALASTIFGITKTYKLTSSELQVEDCIKNLLQSSFQFLRSN